MLRPGGNLAMGIWRRMPPRRSSCCSPVGPAVCGATRYLSGWLFLALSYCIRNTKQQRSRRERREQEAAAMRPEKIEPEAKWEEIAPVLEEAVGRLGKAGSGGGAAAVL